jgi:acetyl-CoA C-acetyltransferase
MSEDIYIVAARRTPIGSFQGVLSALTAPQLGAAAAQAAIKDSGVDAAQIDETIFGCVLMAGIGQAPGRQAALAAGVPQKVPATTVNKMCGSGLKAVMLAADQIRAGSAQIVLAGGIESMTNAPYLLPKARAGLRMGHAQLIDHMFFDGLQSPFDGNMMGFFADATSKKYGFTRGQQDEYAAESVRRALTAVEKGYFDAEVAAATVQDRKGERVVAKDETPFTCDIAKIPNLKPAFGKDGTVTAASSSSISDGAGSTRRREWRQGAREQFEAAGSYRRARQFRAGARVVYDCTGRRNAGGARENGLEGGPGGLSTRSTRRSRASRWLRFTI